jgi:hypothetical protein
MRKSLGLAALALAAGVAVPAPANAAGARVCETTGTATFSPELNLISKTGTVTFNYSFLCVVVDDSGATGLQSGSLAVSYDYEGSCLTATLTGGSGGLEGVIVGGTAGLTFTTSGRVGARALVLVPDVLSGSTPCDVERATFVNVGPDVFF